MRSVRFACASSDQRRPWPICTWAARPTRRASATKMPASTTWSRTAGFAIASAVPTCSRARRAAPCRSIALVGTALVRPTRCGEEYDLAVARKVEPQALLGARHQDRAALRGADAALQIGAVRLEVGAPGAQG